MHRPGNTDHYVCPACGAGMRGLRMSFTRARGPGFDIPTCSDKCSKDADRIYKANRASLRYRLWRLIGAFAERKAMARERKGLRS